MPESEISGFDEILTNKICSGDNGNTWYRIDTKDQARAEGVRMGSAIGHVFDECKASTEMFVALRSPENQSLVSGLIPIYNLLTGKLYSAHHERPVIHFVAKFNANPWKAHSKDIELILSRFNLDFDRRSVGHINAYLLVKVKDSNVNFYV